MAALTVHFTGLGAAAGTAMAAFAAHFSDFGAGAGAAMAAFVIPFTDFALEAGTPAMHASGTPLAFFTDVGARARTAMADFGTPVNFAGTWAAEAAEAAVMPPRAVPAMAAKVAAVQIMTLRRMGSSFRSSGCADVDHCGQPVLKAG
jgi:hypothetical protein